MCWSQDASVSKQHASRGRTGEPRPLDARWTGIRLDTQEPLLDGHRQQPHWRSRRAGQRRHRTLDEKNSNQHEPGWAESHRRGSSRYTEVTLLDVYRRTSIVILSSTTTTHHNRFTAFFRDHPGEPVPEENFWTLWCKGRFTEADTLTIRLGATPSGLTSAHIHHPPVFFCMPDALPAAQPTVSKHWRQCTV